MYFIGKYILVLDRDTFRLELDYRSIMHILVKVLSNQDRAVQILRIDDFIENQIQNRKNYRYLGAIRRDANPRPSDPEVNGLPIELLPQFH